MNSGEKCSPDAIRGRQRPSSDLGWAIIGRIDGDHITEDAADGADITRISRHQLVACTYQVLRTEKTAAVEQSAQPLA